MFAEIGRWRAQRLGKKAVRRLYPVLIRRYGKSDNYTPGQIGRALEISGLGRRYRPYAHAVFAARSDAAAPDPALGKGLLSLTRHHGLTAALQGYALSYLDHFGQITGPHDGGNQFAVMGTVDGGGGSGGGDCGDGG